MIHYAFHYRLLTHIFQQSNSLSYPQFLKEIVKTKDIGEVSKLEDFFLQELQQASFQSKASVDYFLFLTRESLLTSFYRRDLSAFQNQLEVIRHRMTALRSVAHSPQNINSWEQFFEMLEAGLLRLIRHAAIETYESHISDLDWTLFDNTFIAHVSNVIGFTYLHEDNAEQKQKARIWLMKALGEFENDEKLNASVSMATYFIMENTEEAIPSLEQIIEQIKAQKNNLGSGELTYLFDGALVELEGQLLKMKIEHQFGAEDLEEIKALVRDYESSFDALESKVGFIQNQIQLALAYIYSKLSELASEELDQANYIKTSGQQIESALEKLAKVEDEGGHYGFRMAKASLAVMHKSSQTEKEMKEIVQYYKKCQDYPNYMLANNIFAGLHRNNKSTKKSYDLIQDIFKLGQKKIEYGGFFLQCEGLKMANYVFSYEKVQPGVSWMVEILAEFFEKVLHFTESVDESLEMVQKSLLENFRATCMEFEPISHFNIKVYLQYQLLEIKLLKLGAKITQDKASLKLAEKLLSGLANKNNPMYFIHADWDEFKDVPNEVRNKTLNKCIDITKGDLPGAAEHLSFSYRNLRSYITFKEVNRLGFFLHQQETNNRQLELGIRYMFYDLYKQGTIFEVVFDMPKFLVDHANDGFYSQDLEEDLKIKGTTAKKYIKIMMESGLIRQDKTTGRRHYYRLVRENVMNRLGKDQNTLIESAQ